MPTKKVKKVKIFRFFTEKAAQFNLCGRYAAYFRWLSIQFSVSE